MANGINVVVRSAGELLACGIRHAPPASYGAPQALLEGLTAGREPGIGSESSPGGRSPAPSSPERRSVRRRHTDTDTNFLATI